MRHSIVALVKSERRIPALSHCRGRLTAACSSPMKTNLLLACLALVLFAPPIALTEPASTSTVRVAAAQAARRTVDFHLKPEEALAAVDQNLAALERVVDRAGEGKCDVLVFPEDTPGLLNWLGANEALAN